MAVPLDLGSRVIDACSLVLPDPAKSNRSASAGILNGTAAGLRLKSLIEAEAEFPEILTAAIQSYAIPRELRVGTLEIAPDLIG